MNNTGFLFIMQCSLGKPWVLAFMWMAHWHASTSHCCRLSTHSLWQWCSLMAGIMCPARPLKLLKNDLRNMTKSSSYRPGLQISQNIIQWSICGTCRIWLWTVCLDMNTAPLTKWLWKYIVLKFNISSYTLQLGVQFLIRLQCLFASIHLLKQCQDA